jgi:hypothetical protein
LGQAQTEAQTAGLIVETHGTWSQQPVGTVIEQDPPAGSFVQSLSLLRLTVSSGTRVPVGASLDGKILLVAYELPRLEYQPGDSLPITLIWQAMQALDQSYTVFVHLSRADGQPVAQHDSLPAGGSQPTDSWPLGSQINDLHQLTIPAGTAPGEYWLRVGMYSNGVRLPVADPGQATDADDSIILQSVTVK